MSFDNSTMLAPRKGKPHIQLIGGLWRVSAYHKRWRKQLDRWNDAHKFIQPWNDKLRRPIRIHYENGYIAYWFRNGKRPFRIAGTMSQAFEHAREAELQYIGGRTERSTGRCLIAFWGVRCA